MPASLGTPLPNGSTLPNLPDFLASHNQRISISEIKRANGIVIAFIHGTWCPYCLDQLTRLNRVEPQLAERQVGLTCISHDPETTVTAYQLSASPSLRFSLLADTEPSIAHIFGIFDENPHHQSPFPAVFYVDRDDVIRFSDVSSDPHCYPNLKELVAAIDASLE